MIFIPFFKKIDWSKPPLITIALILLNCLIFFIFQGNDDKLTEEAYQYYMESELPRMEMPLYVKYLNAGDDWERAQAYQDYLDSQPQQAKQPKQPKQRDPLAELDKPRATNELDAESYQLLMLAAPMKQDSVFYQQLKKGEWFASQDHFKQWQTMNKAFETRLNKVVTYSHGLKPNEPTLVTLFTNMFLHGGFGHLLGNMIFLFIIGFVVEAALGMRNYTIGYLLAGLCGGFLYIAFNSDSGIPTVGASGAIAGLMGMYTVLFGLRKINFFYFVFVYFDYVKAPAIVLLPIWLGHELFQLAMAGDDGVNYYAHIGGMCSGALFAFVMKHYFKNVDTGYLDQNEIAEEKIGKYEKAMAHLSKLQVEKALPILRQLVEEHPGNRDYLTQWYKAAKLQPFSEDYHAASAQIMMLKNKDPKTWQLVHATYLEYLKIADPKPRLNVQLGLHLIGVFALAKCFDDAEKLLAMVKNHKIKAPVAEAMLILATAFHKDNNPGKCQHYLNVVLKDFSTTPAAAEADQRLQHLQSRSA